ncbi:MAG: hypothetical protein ABIJ59_10900 [Pseudomonadota bacterium]
MHSLETIRKMNGQNPNQARQTGKFRFDKTAGCLVYDPSGVNGFEKEKSVSKESEIKQ